MHILDDGPTCIALCTHRRHICLETIVSKGSHTTIQLQVSLFGRLSQHEAFWLANNDGAPPETTIGLNQANIGRPWPYSCIGFILYTISSMLGVCVRVCMQQRASLMFGAHMKYGSGKRADTSKQASIHHGFIPGNTYHHSLFTLHTNRSLLCVWPVWKHGEETMAQLILGSSIIMHGQQPPC